MNPAWNQLFSTKNPAAELRQQEAKRKAIEKVIKLEKQEPSISGAKNADK